MFSLKVLSINVPYSPFFNIKDRLRHICEFVNKEKIDIICFQEILFERNVFFIKKFLKGYECVYFKKRNLIRGGIVTFLKFEVLDSRFVSFKTQNSLHPFSLSDRFLDKGFIHSSFEFNGEKIELLNTHLIAKYSNLESELRVHQSQISFILNYLLKIQGKLILGGDFNFSENDISYTGFLSKSGLFDPHKGKNYVSVDTKKRGSFFYRMLNFFGPRKMDFIFLGGFDGFVEEKIVFREPFFCRGKKINVSDHLGVYCLIYLN